MYGYKQVFRRWYAKSQEFLTKMLKFENCLYELCLLTFRKKRISRCIFLNVHDLLIATSSRAEFLRMNTELSSYFKMTSATPARELLSIQTIRDRSNRSLFSATVLVFRQNSWQDSNGKRRAGQHAIGDTPL